MNERIGSRPRIGRVFFGCVAALIFGVLHPFVTTYQVMLPMTIPCISALIAVLLYASAGAIPVILLVLTALAVSVLGVGPALMAVTLPLWVMPAAAIIIGVRKRKNFFAQMRTGIGFAMGGAVFSVVLAALFFGSDMIALMISQIQAMMEVIMPELWKMYEPAFISAGLEMTYEEYASTFYSVLKMMQQYYELYLPANLLKGAAITGVIGALWGNWKLAKRGLATPESFVGLGDWYLPANLTYGILLTLAVGFVLKLTPVSGAQTAWLAVSQLAMLAFGVQALAANDRRMKMAGAGRGHRCFMGILIGVPAAILDVPLLGVSLMTILAVLGGISALFGRRGALRAWMDRQKEKMDGEE